MRNIAVTVSVCGCDSRARVCNFAYFGTCLAVKQKNEKKKALHCSDCWLVSFLVASAVALCFFVSVARLLPALGFLCLSHFVALHGPPPPPTLLHPPPPPPPLHRLSVWPGSTDPVERLSWVFLFFLYYHYLYLSRLCLLTQTKGQVGIKVDARLNKEKPTKRRMPCLQCVIALALKLDPLCFLCTV